MGAGCSVVVLALAVQTSVPWPGAAVQSLYEHVRHICKSVCVCTPGCLLDRLRETGVCVMAWAALVRCNSNVRGDLVCRPSLSGLDTAVDSLHRLEGGVTNVVCSLPSGLVSGPDGVPEHCDEPEYDCVGQMPTCMALQNFRRPLALVPRATRASLALSVRPSSAAASWVSSAGLPRW